MVIVGKIGLLGIIKDLRRIQEDYEALRGKSLEHDKGFERIVIITEMPS